MTGLYSTCQFLRPSQNLNQFCIYAFYFFIIDSFICSVVLNDLFERQVVRNPTWLISITIVMEDMQYVMMTGISSATVHMVRMTGNRSTIFQVKLIQ